MSKRTPGLPRRDKDNYPTPCEACAPVTEWMRQDGTLFAEPCAGEGHLVAILQEAGFTCVDYSDIRYGRDALTWKNPRQAMIITNPPWDRKILHPMIEHFISFHKPVWLLLDADWMHTRQAVPYLDHCTTIISIGRVKWMPGTKQTGFDNAAWYRFQYGTTGWPSFISRQQ